MTRPPPTTPPLPPPPSFPPPPPRLCRRRDFINRHRALRHVQPPVAQQRQHRVTRDPRQDRAVQRRRDHLVIDLQHDRSEEHTSELQSPCNLVCRLLLEKKKKN